MEKAYYRPEQSKVTIDIGGKRFVTKRSTLLTVPNTRLSDMLLVKNSNNDSAEFFFDRNPFLFEYILDYYRSGTLHLPHNRCGMAIKAELEFWGLHEAHVSSCCWHTFIQSTNAVATQLRIAKEFSVLSQRHDAGLRAQTPKEKVWAFLAYPEWSPMAKIYALVSGFLVILSMLMLLLATLPEMRTEFISKPSAENETESGNCPNTSHVKQGRVLRTMATTKPHSVITYTDLAIAVLFGIELVTKFLSCPNKFAFMKSFRTITDAVYLAPIFVLHVIHCVDNGFWPSLQNSRAFVLLQILFVLRVLRLHRVACCLRGYKVLVLSLRASLKELTLLITLTLFTAIIFAFVIFFLEMAHQDSIHNAFVGMWWAVITMTSVGYGDVYPVTPGGYVIGVLCAFVGIIALSLPVPMIANNFNIYYAYREELSSSLSKNPWQGEHQLIIANKLTVQERVELVFMFWKRWGNTPLCS
ncbi:potassium voltage-gated channel protein Shaw-like [Liolophura sinensis]|uniref:potassium voltage-gated channel protein Shaw-like n=1 Tax=Liolophura sinensis TaxID=3198878 RepID=UPI0031587803